MSDAIEATVFVLVSPTGITTSIWDSEGPPTETARKYNADPDSDGVGWKVERWRVQSASEDAKEAA